MMLGLLLQIETVPATGESAVDFTWLFVKMLLVLGIVTVSAILLLKYAVPHIGVMKRFQQGRYFTVLGRYLLEPRKALYLVNVGKRYLVIGVSDHAISLISEISEEEALKAREQGLGTRDQ
jgi:flagellar biosynthetic protein FliO